MNTNAWVGELFTGPELKFLNSDPGGRGGEKELTQKGKGSPFCCRHGGVLSSRSLKVEVFCQEARTGQDQVAVGSFYLEGF